MEQTAKTNSNDVICLTGEAGKDRFRLERLLKRLRPREVPA